jgi:hypothetical protein
LLNAASKSRWVSNSFFRTIWINKKDNENQKTQRENGERGEETVTDPLSINVRTSKKKQEESKEETKKPTFFLCLVVFPTAKTPFLIALVLKCCNTTWLGTGKNTTIIIVIEGIVELSIVIVLEPEGVGWGVGVGIGVGVGVGSFNNMFGLGDAVAEVVIEEVAEAEFEGLCIMQGCRRSSLVTLLEKLHSRH